jgi:hypothetical protein
LLIVALFCLIWLHVKTRAIARAEKKFSLYYTKTRLTNKKWLFESVRLKYVSFMDINFAPFDMIQDILHINQMKQKKNSEQKKIPA